MTHHRGVVAACITAQLIAAYFALPVVVWFGLTVLTGLGIAIAIGRGRWHRWRNHHDTGVRGAPWWAPSISGARCGPPEGSIPPRPERRVTPQPAPAPATARTGAGCG